MKNLLCSTAIFVSIAISIACLILTEEPEEELQASEAAITAAKEMAQTVETTPTEEPTQESLVMSRDWDTDDSYLLAKIAMAEAEGESTKGKALVICVVLNRVWSKDFEGTIQEVIFEENQFTTVSEGGRWWTTEPNEDCYKAVSMVMNGWDESQGALYFESSEDPTWHSRNLEFLFKVGNHKFYR